ncbi:MAG: SDR family NAD(P)-dependent oxidoreductase [Nanoarchaeota archaeon]|nr:SDR family NAD(P)-dependent oxidoreductase [DPANN group archaeon]MBL7116647.1 SDR family NAD(P)-dependent oxidoreductase [Nanoarchaeota archaeon]
MRTILVTGGAGFIGSHVCDKLLSEGERIICVDNLNAYYDPKFKRKNITHNLRNKSFKFYKVDITHYNELFKIFSKHKIDSVVHLAARAGVRPSIKNPHIYESVNIKGTLNLLDLSRHFKIKNFVFGSSSSVYGVNRKVPFSESDRVIKQVSPYAVTKRAGELFCNNYHYLYNLNTVALRFFTVYGPRGRPDMAPYKFTARIYHGLPIQMYGDGSSARDYTYVGDIVEGVLSALNKEFGFEIINLGDSKPVKLKRFIEVVEDAVGRKAIIEQKEMPQGDVPITYADISKAKRLLGYKPKIKIEEGIKMFVEWYKNERA